MSWSFLIQWIRVMIVRCQSYLENTKESALRVCDKPYHTNKSKVQKAEEIEVLRNLSFTCKPPNVTSLWLYYLAIFHDCYVQYHGCFSTKTHACTVITGCYSIRDRNVFLSRQACQRECFMSDIIPGVDAREFYVINMVKTRIHNLDQINL